MVRLNLESDEVTLTLGVFIFYQNKYFNIFNFNCNCFFFSLIDVNKCKVINISILFVFFFM